MPLAAQTRRRFLTASFTGLVSPFFTGSTALTGHLPDGTSEFDRVTRWDIVTIGNLSRNRYWGESDEKGVRSIICTCTLITASDFLLLVDPTLAEESDMAHELDRRTGRGLDEITHVFITHEHGDHWAGIRHFPSAEWLAAPAVAMELNKRSDLAKPVEGANQEIGGIVEIFASPGHTPIHHSLRFTCESHVVIVAGDAVPTRDFFRDRLGYYNATDFEESARTMEAMAESADIIIPGHDNFFLVSI